MSSEISIYEAAYQGDFDYVRRKVDDDPMLIKKLDDVSFL